MSGRDPVETGIARLRGHVDARDVQVPAVSGWSVGMHVEHCCLAMTGIGRALVASTPPPPRRRRRWRRWLILTLRRIPRGRAQAPEVARPGGEADGAALETLLDEAAGVLGRAREGRPDAWFEHFVLGVMDRDESLRFLAVHNDHHLKIIGDILAAAGREPDRASGREGGAAARG